MRDPLDILTPKQREERKPHFSDSFWAQVPDMRPTAPRAVPATYNTCRFDVTHRRVYHVRGGCPHFPEAE
jgi:hypothetical protein